MTRGRGCGSGTLTSMRRPLKGYARASRHYGVSESTVRARVQSGLLESERSGRWLLIERITPGSLARREARRAETLRQSERTADAVYGSTRALERERELGVDRPIDGDISAVTFAVLRTPDMPRQWSPFPTLRAVSEYMLRAFPGTLEIGQDTYRGLITLPSPISEVVFMEMLNRLDVPSRVLNGAALHMGVITADGFAPLANAYKDPRRIKPQARVNLRESLARYR